MKEESVVLDSSVWIEILGSGPLRKACERELNAATAVTVPASVIFEVYRKISRLTEEDLALSAVSVMSQHAVTDLTSEIALLAADLSLEHNLATSDSIILAHAVHQEATLITLDNAFAEIRGARVLRRI